MSRDLIHSIPFAGALKKPIQKHRNNTEKNVRIKGKIYKNQRIYIKLYIYAIKTYKNV